MAKTTFPASVDATLSDTWDGANKYTAASEIAVLLCNPSNDVLYFTLTADDTPPTGPLARSPSLKTHDRQPLTLAAGERLWVAGHGAFAVIEA